MKWEPLKVLVLARDQVSDPSLMETLPNLPQLQFLGQMDTPEPLLKSPPEVAPDLVIIDLDRDEALPDWLTSLQQSLPQTAILLCSHNRDPDFLIRINQAALRFLPLPMKFPDLEAALERVQIEKQHIPYHKTQGGKLIVVTGLKGGMGVTSTAVNLAVALAETNPKRVVLVDLGRPFPDVAAFLDQKRTTSMLDLLEHGGQVETAYVLKTLKPHQSGLSVLHGCENLEKFDAKVIGKTWDILRNLFRWIVIDLSHFLDSINLKTLQDADTVLLVTDLLLPNLENLKRWWEQYDKWQLDREKVKVVVNRYQKDEGVSLEDLQQLQHHPVFYTLPNDFLPLSSAINRGLPLKEVAPKSRLCKALQSLAEILISSNQEASVESAPPPKHKRWYWPF